MKNIKVIGFGLLIMGALLLSSPATAQKIQDQWQTSTMQTSGSAYSSNVTAVGATSAASVATTTESYSPAKAHNGLRRGFDNTPDIGDEMANPGSPIGDAVLPLLALACVYMVYSASRVYRRKRRA